MTDRIKGFVVTLEHDYRNDDAAVIRAALEMVKGVISVSPVVADISDHMNRMRIRLELREKLLGLLHHEDGR
jgi:hypothetical protein